MLIAVGGGRAAAASVFPNSTGSPAVLAEASDNDDDDDAASGVIGFCCQITEPSLVNWYVHSPNDHVVSHNRHHPPCRGWDDANRLLSSTPSSTRPTAALRFVAIPTTPELREEEGEGEEWRVFPP